MRIHKILAVSAGLAVMLLGTGVARADSGGLDPHAKITVPTDPVIESCADAIAANPSISCFTMNDAADPADIAGPTAAQIASNPNFDIVSDFIYEPTNCVPSSGPNAVCPQSDTLMNLFLAVIPTIGFGHYDCSVGATTGDAIPAFNSCTLYGATPLSPPDTTEGGTNPAPGGYVELELSCDPQASACTGMLPGQEGESSITPEPGTLLLLGAGLPLMALYGFKRRKTLNLGN
jgi:hypothetical protein